MYTLHVNTYSRNKISQFHFHYFQSALETGRSVWGPFFIVRDSDHVILAHSVGMVVESMPDDVGWNHV